MSVSTVDEIMPPIIGTAMRRISSEPVPLLQVILRTPEEIDLWMTAPAVEVLTLQKPLPDYALKIVARGKKEDGPAG